MATYSELKISELNWFKVFSPGLQIPEKVDPSQIKFELMKKLKSQSILSNSNSVTLIWPLRQLLTDKTISFNYQRQDFAIEGPATLEIFYPGLKSSSYVFGRFTTSGQAATFGLSLALKNYDPAFSIQPLISGCYFESKRVFDGLGIETKINSETMFLDSSALTKDPLEYLNGVKLIRLIVDTTNWNIDSNTIQSIIDWSSRNSCELLLVRSHLKLDCLGGEYGLLGSIVRIETKNEEWERNLVDTLAYSGLIASYEQVYPFLWDPEFLRLTSERTERIRANTKFLTDGLASYVKSLSRPMRLQTYDHQLYFSIVFKGKAELHQEQFLKLSKLHEIPVKFCNSFGFDFFSLTNFIAINEKTEENYIRLCPGDNCDQIEDYLKLVKDYLLFFDR